MLRIANQYYTPVKIRQMPMSIVLQEFYLVSAIILCHKAKTKNCRTGDYVRLKRKGQMTIYVWLI